MTVLLLSDDRMLLHDPGQGHSERPQRLHAIRGALGDRPSNHIEWATPKAATVDDLTRVHSHAYVQQIMSVRGRSAVLDADTSLSPGSVDAALLSAGGAMAAVDAVLGASHQYAFSIGRPPGHHAEHHLGMGFCVFNNIAVAAAHALQHHDLQRVLIFDWDVHHGNGTQDIFYHRDDVLFISTHQSPWYPGTGAVNEIGEGAGTGFTVNLPLPARVNDAVLMSLLDRIVKPIAAAFHPQLVLISAGFDAHVEDPLGELNVTDAGFAAMTARTMGVARSVDAPLALVLEGGYNLDSLGRSVRACVEQLAGVAKPPDVHEQPAAHHKTLIDDLVRAHSTHWPVVAEQ